LINKKEVNIADKPEKQAENRRLVEAGKATRWKSGQSGNPDGRPPKRECLTSLLKEEIERVVPEDPKGRTWKELLVLATMQLALKGNRGALKEIWERMDGKVQQAVAFEDHQAEKVDVEAAAEQFRLEIKRIAQRQISTEPLNK
jgi:hypothetical protein